MRALRSLLALTLLMPSTALADCKTDVDAAFEKLRATGSFRLQTKIVNAQGQLTMESDYILPDRMHQRVMMDGSSTPMEMILIGKKAWSNQGQGWSEVPEKFAETIARQMKETVVDPPKAAVDYKCLGDKDLEGRSFAAYQGILPTPIPAEAEQKGPRISAVSVPNQQNVYIDKSTGLPVRNIVTPVTEPEKRLFDGTFTVVEGLKIEAPTDSKAN